MRRCTPAVIVLMLSGCVQPYYGPMASRGGSAAGLATQDETASVEQQDRISRFRRLALTNGVAAPTVDQIMLPPGSVSFMSGEVPVVRVVFNDQVFFDFNSANPRPEAAPIFDLIAENMKHDVPDAALTVIGHTDAVGTDMYNLDLSRRRAESVMKALVARGVSVTQLSEIAIGKRQPIAPNNTDEGRAINRRVEFLISPALSANLAAVQQRVIPSGFFSLGATEQRAPSKLATKFASVAKVYRLRQASDLTGKSSESAVHAAIPDEDPELATIGGLQLSPVSSGPLQQSTLQSVNLAPTMPVVPVHLIEPDKIEARSLGNDNTSY